MDCHEHEPSRFEGFKLHSIPRGVSPEGQKRQAEKARETMKKLWAERWRPNGKRYSAEGRARISEAQKRRHAATRAKRQEASR